MTLPSKSATKVEVATRVIVPFSPAESTVVVPSANLSSDSSKKKAAEGWFPLWNMKPTSLTGTPPEPVFRPIRVSLTSRLVVFTLVSVPLTVRLPDRTILLNATSASESVLTIPVEGS